MKRFFPILSILSVLAILAVAGAAIIEVPEAIGRNISVIVGGSVAAATGCSEGSGHLIVGINDTSGTEAVGGAFIYWSAALAAHTCNVDRIVIRLSDAGTAHQVRAAIYADSGSNAPTGSPLASSTETTTTAGDGVAEDVTVTLSSTVAITQGTKYWIGQSHSATSSSVMHQHYQEGSTNSGYQSWTYHATNAFPTASMSTWSREFSQYAISQ